MSETPQDLTDPQGPDEHRQDQDAEPASQPEGAAASDGTAEEAAGDQDAGPASG